MRNRKKIYKVGSVIVYSPFGGGRRTVRVDEKDSDIKNGRPGFGGVLLKDGEPVEDGGGVWGYDSQIITVLRQ